MNGDGDMAKKMNGDGDMAKKMNGDGDMAKKMNGDGDEDPPFERLFLGQNWDNTPLFTLRSLKEKYHLPGPGSVTQIFNRDPGLRKLSGIRDWAKSLSGIRD